MPMLANLHSRSQPCLNGLDAKQDTKRSMSDTEIYTGHWGQFIDLETCKNSYGNRKFITYNGGGMRTYVEYSSRGKGYFPGTAARHPLISLLNFFVQSIYSPFCPKYTAFKEENSETRLHTILENNVETNDVIELDFKKSLNKERYPPLGNVMGYLALVSIMSLGTFLLCSL
jgi:hypothetical protein